MALLYGSVFAALFNIHLPQPKPDGDSRGIADGGVLQEPLQRLSRRQAGVDMKCARGFGEEGFPSG
jgi:hypothetical protein